MKAEETKKAEVQNDNVTTVVEGTEMGDIKIHENVIATLVRKAALTIEGVSRLAGSSLVDNIAEIVGSRRMQARAIALEMDESHRVAIEVKINILVGYNVPELAQNVQKAVIEMVEQTTGMSVTKVNVLVQDIEEPIEEAEESEAAVDVTAIPMN